MKIAVLIKGVPDTASVIEVAGDGRSVTTSGLKTVINPFDEFALEEAVRIREKCGGEVKALSLGGDELMEPLRLALAGGADNATLIREPSFEITSRGISIVLARFLKTWEPDLVLAGFQAIDLVGVQVPARIAELLGVPHASSVIRTEPLENKLRITRDLEEERWICDLDYPALITVQKGINTPRYPTVPDVLKARKKEITSITLKELGVDEEQLQPGLVVESMTVFDPSRKRKILEGDLLAQVRTLVSAFAEEHYLL